MAVVYTVNKKKKKSAVFSDLALKLILFAWVELVTDVHTSVVKS